MTKPRIVIACRIFPDMLAKLRERYEVADNQDNAHWSPEEFQARLKGAVGVLLLPSDRLDAVTLQKAPMLKVASTISVGYNHIDVAACTAAKVVCTNTPGVLTEATADLGFALLMAAARRVAEGDRYVHAGKWKAPLAFDAMMGTDVHGATLGIVGMGRIGQAIAKRGAHGFGMKVIYHNRHRLASEEEAPLGARYGTLDEVLTVADHVMLVLPYSPQAHHLIGARELGLMKPTATLINMARGGIVDENALADALAAHRIAAAGLDVYEGEPKVNSRLLALENVVMTPHIGSATQATRRAMCELAIGDLEAVLAGRKPQAAVNPEVLK